MKWLNRYKQWIQRKIKGTGLNQGWAERVFRDQQRLKEVLPNLLGPDSNCVDIGAHKGNFLNHILEYSPKGSHLAFEPLIDLYHQLKINYPNVNVYNLALSDYQGIASFIKVDNAPAWSGFAVQQYPMDVQTTQLQVTVNKLDNMVSSDFPVHFIKLDVEGAELQVLNGASDIMEENRPAVLFEYAAIHAAEYSTEPKQIFQFFRQYGMKVYRLDMKARYDQEEFEAVYYSSYDSNYNEHAETNFIACSS